MFRKIFHAFATQLLILSAFSMVASPAISSAAYYQDARCCQASCEQDCCEDNCCGSNWGCWIGGTLLGAAAGAATGAAVSGGRGHRGAQGETGDTGEPGERGRRGPPGAPGSFVADGTNTLSFDASLTVGASLVGAELVFFVSEPDGTVLQTAPVTPAAVGLLDFPALVVSPALFGEYATGIQISDPTLVAAATAVTIDVTASRDGSVTTLVLTTPTVAIGDQAQASSNFVYGEDPLP